MAAKPQKTLADYVAIAVCPALIMALVGSLMFFLLEVFHKGPHDDRLRWAVSCFVIGVVLIARISMMQEISERAGLYGLALGVVAYIVVNKYIEYPASNPLAPIGWLVNLLIMAVVWWSAHRLTFDCTLIDDEADASGQGLLQAAGIDNWGRHAPGGDASRSEATTLPEKPDDSTDPALSWWERYRARRQKRLRGHTPGIWIVYYSLAALPLFGLGQLMIPDEPADRRRYAFWLLAIYVAAGLCLLLATSFLGLRRYLRQRKVQMPAAMTGVWFTVGAGFVAALLLLAFLLPRPSAEYFNVVALLTGEEQKATEFDVLGGKGAKGKGSQTGKGPGKKPGGTAPGKLKGGERKKSDQQWKDGDPQGDQQSDQQGKDGQNSKSGNSKDGRTSKNDKTGKSDTSSKDSQQKDGSQEKSDAPEKHDPDADQRKQGDKRDKPTDEKRDQTKDEQGGNSEEQKQEQEQEQEQEEPDDPESPLSMLGTILKWLFYIIAALVTLYVLIRHWRKVLAMLRGAWQALLELWAWLLGKLKLPARDELSALENPAPDPPPPFSSFANPFLSGMVETKSVNYVTRYTFAALQAWAYERGLGREPGETPIEFCQRLTEDIPAFEQNVRRLGENYSRVSYARATLSRPSLDALQALWQRMTLPVREAAGISS